jgi:hypothetical protein
MFVNDLAKEDIHFPFYKVTQSISDMPGFRSTPVHRATTNTATNPTMITTQEYMALEAQARPNLMRQLIGLIKDNSLSKWICFSGGLIGPMTFKVLLYSENGASPQH